MTEINRPTIVAMIVVLWLLCFLLTTINIRLQSRYLYTFSLFWEDFDHNLNGLIRMINLLNFPGESEWLALISATEYALNIRNLAFKAELLLRWRGIEPEPLEGYLLSLTGGVINAACQAHKYGFLDLDWLNEIKRRIQGVHSIINRNSVLGPKELLQNSIEDLFSLEIMGSLAKTHSDEYPHHLPVTHLLDPFAFCP